MPELWTRSRKDFEGYDDLRHKLLHNVPKYGNDNAFVDNYVRKAGQIYCREVEQYKGPYGEQYWGGEFAVSSNVPHGLVTGALPSGRKAKEPLANGGISATNGSDMNGPTSVIKSAAKVDSVTACNGTLLI
jgi:formate C-acetyltransferase